MVPEIVLAISSGKIVAVMFTVASSAIIFYLLF
jgi:hypothetical protein